MVAGFARGNCAVMANTAHRGGFAVGKRHDYRQPGRAGMASIAVIAGQRMASALANGDSAIVAAATHIRRLAVGKRHDHG